MLESDTWWEVLLAVVVVALVLCWAFVPGLVAIGVGLAVIGYFLLIAGLNAWALIGWVLR